MEILNKIIENKELICETITGVWAICTVMGLVTPSNNTTTFFGKIGSFFDRIGTKIKK